MNVFYLDSDPKTCAEWMVDKHVVKMVLETAQLLSTAHRVLDGTKKVVLSPKGRKKSVYILDDARDQMLYQAISNVNHPSAVWARSHYENYYWLFEHFCALMVEYNHRYKKHHKCEFLIELLQFTPKNIKISGNGTQPPPAMLPKYIISSDATKNYRNYYVHGKSHIHKWTGRNPPTWIKEY